MSLNIKCISMFYVVHVCVCVCAMCVPAHVCVCRVCVYSKFIHVGVCVYAHAVVRLTIVLNFIKYLCVIRLFS